MVCTAWFYIWPTSPAIYSLSYWISLACAASTKAGVAVGPEAVLPGALESAELEGVAISIRIFGWLKCYKGFPRT